MKTLPLLCLLLASSLYTLTAQADDHYGESTSNPEARRLFIEGYDIIHEGANIKDGVTSNERMVKVGLTRYSEALALDSTYWEVYASRGLTYFHLKKYDEAMQDYNKALQYNPKYAPAWSNMGYIYFVRNEYEQAKTVYEKALDLNPHFVDAHRNLGVIYALQKEYKKAIKQWKKGLKEEPDNAILLFFIGSAYIDSGKPDKGQPWLERAYAIEPGLKK